MTIGQSVPRRAWGSKLAIWAALVLLPAIVFAYKVTIAQVAEAVRNSPSANAFLMTNADQIGALAIKVESAGETTAYNGTCCYGILQLSTTNIKSLNLTPAQYQALPLQAQIDGWSKIQSAALKDPIIAKLSKMTTFDGHPVDASFMIACVQLGQGNCAKMVTSGVCSGFKDSNGTTICAMAAKMDAAIYGSATPPGVTPTKPVTPAPGTFGGAYVQPTPVESPNDAFKRGTGGITAKDSAEAFKLAVAGAILLWAAWTALGTWTSYTGGKILPMDMTKNMARSLVITMLVVMFLN